MFRRYLFWGLTLMLAVALVYLVVQGRRTEKQKTARTVEVVRESKATLTRVIAPDDLEIVESKLELSASGDRKPERIPSRRTAKHQIVIRNNAQMIYRNLSLRLSYLGRADKTLDTRTVLFPEILSPGQARSVGEIVVEGVPAGTIKCTAKILHADLEAAGGRP